MTLYTQKKMVTVGHTTNEMVGKQIFFWSREKKKEIALCMLHSTRWTSLERTRWKWLQLRQEGKEEDWRHYLWRMQLRLIQVYPNVLPFWALSLHPEKNICTKRFLKTNMHTGKLPSYRSTASKQVSVHVAAMGLGINC